MMIFKPIKYYHFI
jgi:hypothetical protein